VTVNTLVDGSGESKVMGVNHTEKLAGRNTKGVDGAVFPTSFRHSLYVVVVLNVLAFVSELSLI
jgi:hypothetical protein